VGAVKVLEQDFRRLAMSTWLICGYALGILVLVIVLSLKLYVPYL
jgi:hypothetical protein